MRKCAVALCSNCYRKSMGSISFHRFPKDPTLQKLWVLKCKTKDITIANATVCSSHFSEEDFVEDFRAKTLNLKPIKRLKQGVVPHINLPSSVNNQSAKSDRSLRFEKLEIEAETMTRKRLRTTDCLATVIEVSKHKISANSSTEHGDVNENIAYENAETTNEIQTASDVKPNHPIKNIDLNEEINFLKSENMQVKEQVGAKEKPLNGVKVVSWHKYGKISTYKMQSQKPEFNTCHIDEVPTKMQTEREIATEVPIRMSVRLPQCHIYLRRVTEAEILQKYPSDNVTEISADVMSKTEELVNETVNAVQDTGSSNASSSKQMHLDQYIYELDKDKKSYRRIRVHSDNSVDMSQDEFSCSGSDRAKKKIKRGRKYEYDSEWSPYTPKINCSYGRKLRNRVRKPLIESDTSSDGEWFDSDNYVSDTSSTNSAFRNTVPSGFVDNKPGASSTATNSSVENSTLKSGPLTKEHIAITQNSSQNISGITSSMSISNSSDIVSGIIKEMDECKQLTKKLKISVPSDIPKASTQNNAKPKPQRGRKRSRIAFEDKKSSDKSIANKEVSSKEVAILLQEVVSAVCELHQKEENRKIFNKCKWCHTKFPTNKADETMCAICYDLGKGKYNNSNSNKNSTKPLKKTVSKAEKQNTGNTKIVKKVSNTMSRVLKNLPKHEMQRLIYAEKSGKLSNEKGYNHCKSFSTPKEPNDNQNKSLEAKIAQSCKLTHKTNGEKEKSNRGRKKGTKNSSPADVIKQISAITKAKAKTVENTNSCTKEEDKEGNILRKKNKVALKKCHDGIFLMTFPGDEELNNRMKENSSKIDVLNKTGLESSNQCNGGLATKALIDSASLSSDTNSFQSVAKDEPYQTYLLPPVPTVFVANYSTSKDKNGSFHLSSIFYQNEFTQNSSLQNTVTSNANFPVSISSPSELVSNNIPFQNSAPNLPKTTTLTITTLPVGNNITNFQSLMSNSSPAITSLATSIPNNKVTILPVVTSVVSLSNGNLNQPSLKETMPNNSTNIFTPNHNFVNSEQLAIKITHVSSEKMCKENKSKGSNYQVIDDDDDDGSETTVNDEDDYQEFSFNSVIQNPSISKEIHPRVNKIFTQRNSKSEKTGSNTAHNVEDSEKHENLTDTETIKNTTQQKEYTLQNDSSIVHEALGVTSDSCKNTENEQSLNMDGQAKESNNQGVKAQSDKQTVSAEHNPKDSIKSAIDLLGAISILAVIDLEKNPNHCLTARIQLAKQTLTKITAEKNPAPDQNEKIASCQYNLEVLGIAQRFLNLHGSFSKVSDYLLRKHRMIQIKKEMLAEEEEEEEGENQNSCMFSQKSQATNPSFNNEQDIVRTSNLNSERNTVINSEISIKMENFNACRLNEQSAAQSHIEKLQSQIAAIQNNQISQYETPAGSTIHHYSAEQITTLPPSVAAPTPVTPRNDYMGNESRETPSRGSGPRTPARPESATSQPEEHSLAVQVKKEQFEAASSPSQCAYSHNTTLPQITSQIPEIPSLNMGSHSIPNNTLQNISVSTANQIFTSGHTNLHMQSRDITVNRVPHPYNNQNYSNVLLNISSKHQAAPNVTLAPGINSNDPNRQLLIGHLQSGNGLYIQSGSGQLPTKQAVPSVNNQYIIRPPFTTANTSGTVLVNNSQAGGQNVNALLTNVSNQQFYTANQVPQIYYPPSTQISCMPSSMSTPAVTIAQNQQAVTDSLDQMFCAVCKNVATLRCKQCAKVAYCNTTCAKTYWHQKHKMECKPLPS